MMDINLKLLEQITLNVPNYIFWKDNDLVYRGCNYNFAHSLGFYDVAEIIGKTDKEMPWDLDLAKVYQDEDREILLTERPILEKEVNMILSDGRKRILSVSKVPLYDNNQVIGILGIYIDITPIKKNEAELRQAKIAAEAAAGIAKTIFISYMSHDIKNPLRGVIASSYALQKHLSDEQDRSDCQLIYENASVLMKFLDGILDAATAGDIRDDKRYDETFNLRESIEDLAVLQKLYAKSKDLDLQIEIDEKIPSYVVSDKEKIERVMLNLIGNAINYTEKGHIKVNIKLSSKKGNALNIKFSVEDTGVGIAKDKLDKVFTKGY